MGETPDKAVELGSAMVAKNANRSWWNRGRVAPRGFRATKNPRRCGRGFEGLGPWTGLLLVGGRGVVRFGGDADLDLVGDVRHVGADAEIRALDRGRGVEAGGLDLHHRVR